MLIFTCDYNYIAMKKDLINYEKMTQQYGSAEFDQMLFTLGIKVSFSVTRLNLLDEKRLKLIDMLQNELEARQ